jgi:rod shape-determining protein MreD
VTDGASIIRWVLIVSVTAVLQIGLASQIPVAGVHPELLLLVSICAGLVSGPGAGAGVGFACGLILDLFVPGRMGITALTYVLVGYGAGVAGDAVARPTRGIQAGMVAMASIAGVLLYAAIGQLLGQRSLSDPNLLAIVGIVAAFNAVLAVPVLAVCRWAHPEQQQRLRTR